MNSIIAFVRYAIINYSKIIVCAASIIIGLILAKRAGNNSPARKAAACILPILAAGSDYIFPFIANLVRGEMLYIAISIVIYIICFILLVLAMKLFAGYSPQKWVISVFVIMVLVYALQIYYHAQIIFGFGNLQSLTSGTSGFLMSFMGNSAALTASTLLCAYVPPVTVFIDVFTSVSES